MGRISFLHLESGGEDGISGCGGGTGSGCNDMGGNPIGLFEATARTPRVSVSSFRKRVLGYQPKCDLRQGLASYIEWYPRGQLPREN
jgi:hypothetical protein